ncbi:hypothetical protein H5410_005714 [Solanum commersonii]|uniref:Uncharacterized protein n=1 Tax=Solanum commersonii TaxID=4109 RepID=A0A9J6A7X0_SOLCO|nr:hypothetical protein H5410_005714 [Solanum commersonii]
MESSITCNVEALDWRGCCNVKVCIRLCKACNVRPPRWIAFLCVLAPDRWSFSDVTTMWSPTGRRDNDRNISAKIMGTMVTLIGPLNMKMIIGSRLMSSHPFFFGKIIIPKKAVMKTIAPSLSQSTLEMKNS